MEMIELDLDKSIDEYTLGLDQSSKAVRLALKRALRKLLIWMQRQMLRELSKDSGVTQKNLKRYNRIHIKIGSMDGSIWLGLNPMPLHLAGRVSWSQRSKGARVKGQVFAGAFYKGVYGSERKVWIRSRRNIDEGHARYNLLKQYKPFGGSSDGRFPVEVIGVPLESSKPEIVTMLNKQARNRFEELFQQELEFSLKHEH